MGVMKSRAVKRTAAWLGTIAVLAALNWSMPFRYFADFYLWVAIPVSFYAGVLFLLAYPCMSRWWHTPMGRMIWWLDFAYQCILLNTILVNEYGTSMSVDENYRLQLAGVFIAAVVIVSRFILMVRLNGWRMHLPWNLPDGDHDDERPDSTPVIGKGPSQ